MPKSQGFRGEDGDIFVYFEDGSGGSTAAGIDFSDGSKYKIVMAPIANVNPSGTPAQLVIDPSVNGDITVTPNGAGQVVFPYLGVTGIVVQNDNTGAIYSHNNLDLPTTTDSANGSIRINSSRFVHAFGTDNAFVGRNAGNYTLSSINSTGIGDSSLTSLTTGNENTGIGSGALLATTIGSNNTAAGTSALGNLISGNNNTAIGDRCLDNVTTGSGNTAIGALNWGGASFNGSNNILIATGQFSDNYNGTESSNILIQNDGVLGENNTMRIGTTGAGAGQQNRCFIAGTHAVTPAGASIRSVIMDSSGQIGTLGAATNGQLPIGNTGNAPTLATITAGSGIGIANGAGSITISSSGGGFAWTEVTGTSASLAVNNGYIANNAGLVTLTLPATAALGDTIKVVGKGAGLFRIAQNASQFVNIVSTTTTVGVTGSLTATEQFDCIDLICTTTNNGWIAHTVTGNFTVA